MLIDILKVGCFTLIILSLLMYVFQRNLIYFPAQEVPTRQAYHAMDMQELHLKTSDGIELLAWYKAAHTNQPTILLLHGNAGHIGYRMFLARAFLDVGFGVLLLEYRGYGGNKGSPTEEGFYTDARTAIHFLQQQGIPSQHLVLYGESIGTGVAVKMAEEFPVCALVLQSPYTSLPAVARYHYPWIFIAPSDKYDSLSRIAKVKSPVLILHGKEDKLIPFAQGSTLFNKANEPKIFAALDNKDHNNLWDPNFVKIVMDFIQLHCLIPASNTR
ncbi:alpha/beta hydrolase [Legionella saoudiensis]|uniref:alpha/beta hydrolase n=1 Tax=Legionella saoudiensis TaxID=1750561 RepID=UPI0007305887|nr:alpha/beta hydrolase [Legionella saoudiensis]